MKTGYTLRCMGLLYRAQGHIWLSSRVHAIKMTCRLFHEKAGLLKGAFLGKDMLLNIGKFSLRLTLLACIFYLLFAIFSPALQRNYLQASVSQNGIGGGSIEEPFTIETLAALELEYKAFEFEPFSRPRPLLFSSYSVASGDIIGDLAIKFGLNQDTIISANGIRNTRLIQIGQHLRIPNQDGIFHTVTSGETLASIAERYRTDEATLKVVNKLFTKNVRPGTQIFIPGGRLDAFNLQEINGDLFIWPVPGRFITSPFGWRASPFTGRRQFHNGIDIRGATGTPVWAAMSGRVSAAGWDNIFGNYVIINHHSGFRTLYAHLSVIRVRPGTNVRAGDRIGDIGSTGLSTGPHLHFSVFRNGVAVNPRVLMR